MSAHHESTSRLSALWLRLKMASSVRWPAYSPTRTNRRVKNLVQGVGVVSRRTKLYMYIYDSLGRGRVYAENEMMYGKVYKQKLQQYAITKRIGNG